MILLGKMFFNCKVFCIIKVQAHCFSKDRLESLSVSVSSFDPGFALLIAFMQMKLKGPHFAVALGFSSVSQQKSFPVPKALFFLA